MLTEQEARDAVIVALYCGADEALADFEKAANPFAALADFKFE